MKALILSITTGQGHHQCAKAISDYLIFRGVDCETVDALKYINPILYESVNHGYLLSTQNLPTAYGKVYRLAEKRNSLNMKITPAKITTTALSFKLKKLISEKNPDVIICTHVFSAQLITPLNDLTATTIGIVTDFTFHPYWEETSLDYYVTASEQLNNQAQKKYIYDNEILPFGIPINEKFAKKTDKTEARKQLGIKDKLTVFVMSGSMGYGHMLKQIKKLDKLNIDFQMISVCGNNKNLKKAIDNYVSKKEIYNFGYVNNVDLIMDASDIIITKPGGLTTSEALAKGIPLILNNPIPGQEDRNVEFLLNNGAAMKVTSTFPVDECIYELFTSEWRLKHMTEAAARLAKPNSTKDLGDFIIENCNPEIH